MGSFRTISTPFSRIFKPLGPKYLDQVRFVMLSNRKRMFGKISDKLSKHYRPLNLGPITLSQYLNLSIAMEINLSQEFIQVLARTFLGYSMRDLLEGHRLAVLYPRKGNAPCTLLAEIAQTILELWTEPTIHLIFTSAQATMQFTPPSAPLSPEFKFNYTYPSIPILAQVPPLPLWKP